MFLQDEIAQFETRKYHQSAKYKRDLIKYGKLKYHTNKLAYRENMLKNNRRHALSKKEKTLSISHVTEMFKKISQKDLNMSLSKTSFEM